MIDFNIAPSEFWEMSAQEFHWLHQGHSDRQEKAGGNGFSNGEWRRAHEANKAKMKAKENG